jgi:hypothetical protein
MSTPPTLTCDGCGQPLGPDLRCQQCQYSYCPFCQAGFWEQCEHLFTTVRYDQPGGWIQPPFEPDELPVAPPGLRLAELPDGKKRDVFGKLQPYLAAWSWDEADQREYVDQYRLFDLLLRRLTIPVEPYASHPAETLAHDGQHGYFSQRPDDARWQLALLLGKLSTAFRRLAAED